MNGMAKLLMFLGGAIFIIGFLAQFIKIGRLPGDIIIRKGQTTFFFPIMTCIIISVVLSLIFYIIRKLQ